MRSRSGAQLRRPWIFREINHYLTTGEGFLAISSEVCHIPVDHLDELRFLRRRAGVRSRVPRLFTPKLAGSGAFRQEFNRLETASEQLAAVKLFVQLGEHDGRPPRRRSSHMINE
jgi:tRNA-dihydrouridine synthase B